MLQAVTFDFWDTLFVDDSDEEERARRGLGTKAEARRRLLGEALLAQAPELAAAEGSEADIDTAWAAANAWARARWKRDAHTPTVSARLLRTWSALGLRPGRGFCDLVDAIEAMEADPSPRPVPGAREVLEELGRDYRIGIVSDAIVSPGRTLRRILERHGLLDCFDHSVFSDEIGFSKPHRAVFDAAAEGLGVPVSAIAHVGDREANDVAGPQAVGARAVLFTGVVDRGSADTRADLVCSELSELPRLLADLDRRLAASPGSTP